MQAHDSPTGRYRTRSPGLSVVIPCYNEADTILSVIDAVGAALPENTEIIIVDDASTDGTTELLRSLPDMPGLKKLFHDGNRGKGAAVRTGMNAASGDIVVIQDADLEYDPRDIPALVQPILDNRADVVYGSRFSGSSPKRGLLFWHMAGNRLLTCLSNMLTNLKLTDMETGYKAFRRGILRRIEIEEDRFGFEPEITAKVARLHCRIHEIGISYRGRTYAEGKKITWRDGISALRCIVKYNLSRRPPTHPPG